MGGGHQHSFGCTGDPKCGLQSTEPTRDKTEATPSARQCHSRTSMRPAAIKRSGSTTRGCNTRQTPAIVLVALSIAASRMNIASSHWPWIPSVFESGSWRLTGSLCDSGSKFAHDRSKSCRDASQTTEIYVEVFHFEPKKGGRLNSASLCSMQAPCRMEAGD